MEEAILDQVRVLKHGDTFAVFDRYGDIDYGARGGQGLYHRGTRFLSSLALRLNGLRPVLLNSSVRQDNSLLTVDMTTTDFHAQGELPILKGTVHVFRAKLLWQAACHEHLRVVNYCNTPAVFTLALCFGADYADIFEVRGFRRELRGRDLEPGLLADRVVLGYRGLDGMVRHTAVCCDPRPERLAADRVEYALAIPPGGQTEINVMVLCEPDGAPGEDCDYRTAGAAADTARRTSRQHACSIATSNEQINDWLGRSAADLVMLTTETARGPYPYAGVPWYSTPFGRDGILTALQYLWVNPPLARGVLAYLASMQATQTSPAQDAEPGKIMHETRDGELAALGEIPFGRYYGSIDSTPLFVVLAGAYYEHTGDFEFLDSIWPNIERALGWIDRYGDVDGDGFVEYQRKHATGLINQGWKDSEDAVFHADGALAEGPIALAEVQGYVYRAKLDAATLAVALGRPHRAPLLRMEAAALRERFEQAFWSDELGTYALALDGRKRPCLVRSSNAGQVLWSGIASPEHAWRTGETLMTPQSFSGWGVRTIAEGEARYNPMAYHNGSIWPHDNALIAMGLARYRMKDKTLAVLEALFQASRFMDLHRLPELYCGFVRRPDQGPTLYPVACSPQAWAGASPFYLLQACLGMSFDASKRCIQFDHPLLPSFLERIEIRNLRVGPATVDLTLDRHEHDVGVSVLRKDEGAEVLVNL